MRPLSVRQRKASTTLVTAILVSSMVIGQGPSVLGSIRPTASQPGAAPAAFVPPASTQFDMDGFLQAATLGGPGTGTGAGSHAGGTLMVDNQLITVPSETIVILPANALSWQELFAQAPLPYGLTTTPPSTGLAVADSPKPPYTYEVHVVGNREGDTYIAGLITISQQGLNSGAGYINFINYTTGEFRVGGTVGSATTGARVQLNDPTGRYGQTNSPDPRFTVDADNPTVAAGTGFPMCIPRTDPATADDPACPQGNRPIDPATGDIATIIQTNDPVTLPGVFPDATKQAPMEVGDYVTFAGTLIDDATGSYVSAHTVINNTAIYTWPGTNPAYVTTEVALIGTGGLTVIGAGEAAVRTRFEGMTTDPSRNIHLYGVDLNPTTGATTDRDWGTIGVDQGAPGGAVKGRWRFRPPCDPFGTIEAKPDKKCVMNQSGIFLPPTREVRAVIEGLQTQVPGTITAATSANGIFYGQYHAPIGEYIFPENLPGTPVVPNNFEAMDFLACGGYTSAGGTLAAQLNPWPGAVAPTCVGALTAPVVDAGPNQTVASGSTVTLTAVANGNPKPTTFSWVQAATDVPQVVLTGATAKIATFAAPSVSVPTVLTFTFTATNTVGSASATMTVTVNASTAPTVTHVPAITLVSGQSSTTVLNGTDPNTPASLPLTFAAVQTGTPALTNLVVTQGANPPGTKAVMTFTAPVLPADQILPSVIALNITATNAAGTVSAPELTSVTVNPLPDAVSLTTAVYRISKQRLDLTASSSVISPNVTLTLQPYLTTTGTIFTPPDGTFTNSGGGLYIITLVGVPEPAVPPATPLTVSSNHGGTSLPFALTLIRQN